MYTLSSLYPSCNSKVSPSPQDRPLLSKNNKLALAVDYLAIACLATIATLALINGVANLGPIAPFINTIGPEAAYAMIGAAGGIIVFDSFKYRTQLKKYIQELEQTKADDERKIQEHEQTKADDKRKIQELKDLSLRLTRRLSTPKNKINKDKIENDELEQLHKEIDPLRKKTKRVRLDTTTKSTQTDDNKPEETTLDSSSTSSTNTSITELESCIRELNNELSIYKNFYEKFESVIKPYYCKRFEVQIDHVSTLILFIDFVSSCLSNNDKELKEKLSRALKEDILTEICNPFFGNLFNYYDNFDNRREEYEDIREKLKKYISYDNLTSNDISDIIELIENLKGINNNLKINLICNFKFNSIDNMMKLLEEVDSEIEDLKENEGDEEQKRKYTEALDFIKPLISPEE